MTVDQQRVVEENMGLVGKVIKDKVHGLGQSGYPAYEDLFQTGCIGLCKAAMSDKGGCFSTYAYRLIWNEICDELIRTTKLAQREQITDTIEILKDEADSCSDPIHISDLRQTLDMAKAQAQGVTAKGITCLELAVQGYSSLEISRIVKAEAATVRMWMTKARRFLRELPELREFIYPEAIS